MSGTRLRDDLRNATEPRDLRWVLAAERTLLARFRVSLALFVLGLALVALVPPDVARLPVAGLAAACMVGCAAAAVTGVRRWHRGEQESSGRRVLGPARRRAPGRPAPTASRRSRAAPAGRPPRRDGTAKGAP